MPRESVPYPRARETFMVGAAAVASHATALGAGFVWLDHAHIEEKAAIAPPGRWLELFTHGFAETGFYRPLMALSLSIDALVGGPFVFHLVTIAWHAAAAIATAAAALALGLSRRAAFVGALLFAVHPLSGVVANAIAFRSEAMVTAMLLLLVWAHAERRTAIAAVALFAACLTKEIALGLGPAFVAALELARPKADEDDAGGPRARRRRLVAEGGALAAAALLRLTFAPPFRARPEPLSAPDAIGTRLAALAKSATRVLAPFDLTICDAFPITHAWQPGALAGLLVAGAIAILAWRRRGPAVLLALALLPSLQIVPVMRWWSPHYVYLPAAFALMLAGEVVDRLGDRAALAARALAGALGLVTLLDARTYATDAALWSREVEKRPACREGQFYLGEVDREARRWDAAARRYEAALAPRPSILAYVDHGAALVNLGTVRLEQRRFGEAREVFRRALEGVKDETKRRAIVHDLAAAALSEGDAAEADRLLEPETARPDAMPASLVVRAMALERLERRDEAAKLMSRARAAE